MNKKLVALYFLGELSGLVAAGVAMFWSAGQLDWMPAWAVIGVWILWYSAVDAILLRSNPDLMKERLSPPKDGKAWDRWILSLLRLVQLARYIVAGLDVRYGWTEGFPFAVQTGALLVCILSTVLFTWSMRSNRFFSQVVRIQIERGHAVADGGPYRFVRHPGYLATILFDLALSALLGSYWAILLGGVCAVLLVVRTALEDRTLQAELTGYREYALRVRYRLLPGIW